MSLNTKTMLVSATYACDKRSCTESFTLGSDQSPLGGTSFFASKEMLLVEEQARTLGWSRWHGRSVNHYCPDHGPAKGHQMERSW
jgi:hypothetical protein